MDSKLDTIYQEYSLVPQLAPLRETATQLVRGWGNPQADIFLLGEAPGAEEDLKGEPFVGRSGQWLDKMLQSVGIKRKDCFISNIVKYRPPGNRNPTEEEVSASRPFLMKELKIVSPKVLVPLGTFASKCFIDFKRMSDVNGKLIITPAGNKIFPLYHPSYCLRNGGMENEMKPFFIILAREAFGF